MHVAQELLGEIAVVTGAAKGIGRGIAQALAQAGAAVAILDFDTAGAAEVAAEIEAAGGRAFAVQGDTSKAESLEAARAAITQTLGVPRILVNNAGIRGSGGRVLDRDPEAWQALIDVNLTGYFLAARCFVPAMIAEGGGALVHIGSITAREPLPEGGSYSVAKAGVAMLSRLLAMDYGPDGIRSNVVSPGFIATPMTAVSYSDPAVNAGRLAMVPARRIGTPDDIGQAVRYLAGPLSGYVNGADLLVDGGLAQTLFQALPRGRKIEKI